MGIRSLVVICLLALGCGGGRVMSGFPERDARANEKRETLDACSFRKGRLVLEVESALVREYPPVDADDFGQKKQPLLLLWVREAGAGPGAEAITFEVAPEAYAAGDPIRHFQGQRLLDQPVRLVRGRVLDLRLAENNRTAEPEWQRVTGDVGSGVGSLVLSNTEKTGFNVALDLLRKLDKDDLILLWSVNADTVLDALGSVTEHRALRYRLETARRIGTEPSAETTLLFYLEPEHGCPPPTAPPPAPPAATTSPQILPDTSPNSAR